jgi:hypothetical protein
MYRGYLAGLSVSEFHFRTVFNDPSPLGRLMHFCEIHCVAMCCGPNAYETAPEHVAAWVRSVEPAPADSARVELAELLRGLDGAPDRFFFLDVEHDKGELREFLSELASGLEAAKTAG